LRKSEFRICSRGKQEESLSESMESPSDADTNSHNSDGYETAGLLERQNTGCMSCLLVEEGDADVLERGIVVQSPAFTYTYKDAAPLNYLSTPETDSSNNDRTSHHPTATVMQYQFLGAVCPTSSEALDNAVVFHVRSVDPSSSSSDPPFLSLDGLLVEEQQQQLPENLIQHSIIYDNVNNNAVFSCSSSANSLDFTLGLGNSNLSATTASSTTTLHHLHKLVKRKPSLSGDDTLVMDETMLSSFQMDSVSQLLPQQQQTEISRSICVDNIISPTVPANLLAFRTVVKRSSSNSGQHQHNDSNIPDLYPICELKPTIDFPPNYNEQKEEQQPHSSLYLPIVESHENTTVSSATFTDLETANSISRQLSKSTTKYTRQQRSLSRRFNSSDRLLQEAVQYSEAVGEKPPRSVEEISREIIDIEDDYEYAGSDDDDDEHDNADGVITDNTYEDQQAVSQSVTTSSLHKNCNNLAATISIFSNDKEQGNSTNDCNFIHPLVEENEDIEISTFLASSSVNICDVNKEGEEERRRANTANSSLTIPDARIEEFSCVRGVEDEEESTALCPSPKCARVLPVLPPLSPFLSQATPLPPRDSNDSTRPSSEQPSPLVCMESLGMQDHFSKQLDVMESPKWNDPSSRRFFAPDTTASSIPATSPSQTERQGYYKKTGTQNYMGSLSFGKYMLNPQAKGPGDDSNGSSSFVGIKYHPPEITRGNYAQLHRKAWLEVSDKYHRYGKNLRLYYKHWNSLGHPFNMFFDWLDSKGEAAGQPLPNLSECPRSQLDSDTVLYITDPEVQDMYQLNVASRGEERFGYVLDASGSPVSTGEEGWIFVLRDGKFYGARKVTETAGLSKKRFHHSSFFAGKAVTAAGIFITKDDGRIVCMYPHSGHYRPGEAHMQRLLYFVQRLGIDLITFDVDVQQIAHVARKETIQTIIDENNPNQKFEKRRKEKKADSLYLTPASHVACFLTHKAKMLSKGVFGMIQNIRQVRAASVTEALDAVDNRGYWRQKKMELLRQSSLVASSE